jgi:hypothetical protein
MKPKHDVVEKRNAMAMSLKSRCCKGRCCKVDVVKIKGLPGGGLFDIGVYTFFRPRRAAIYVLRTNPTPRRSRHCLLVSKDKTTKNRKGLSQESKTF